MSILVVGTSHRTASVDLLERLALDTEGASKLSTRALLRPHVTESLVLATCNRVEIYGEVDRFHGSVEDLTALLVEKSDLPAEQVLPFLYVHYGEAAVAHLFSVATGLESMVVGESQILGQVREALRRGQDDETVGPALNSLFQQGLRVGKRAHFETDIDRAGQSLLSVALDEAASTIGPIEGARVLIVGAGSIAALAASSASRRGASRIVVASRTPANAERLASRVGGHSAGPDRLGEELARADLVISCTGATGTVISAELIADAMVRRQADTPLVVVDLALPHDVELSAAALPDVTLVSLKTLADSLRDVSAVDEVVEIHAIVAEEVAAFTTARDAAVVAPTVVALRTMATTVVATELERLWGRVDGLSAEQQDEITSAVRRVADKLLHEPTVRVKQFAGRTPESSYAEALAELFALDSSAVEAVTRAGEPR